MGALGQMAKRETSDFGRDWGLLADASARKQRTNVADVRPVETNFVRRTPGASLGDALLHRIRHIARHGNQPVDVRHAARVKSPATGGTQLD